MQSFPSSNLHQMIVPLAIIAGSILFGILIERFIGRFIYRSFERRNWKIGRRLVRAFNGILTIWCGVAAFRSVLGELPLEPSALPVAAKLASAILLLTFAVLFGRVVTAFIRTYSNHHDSPNSITLIENIGRGFIYTIGLLGVFRTFGVAVTPMLTALGVGGLAVALALQDTLSNFFAGVYIILSRSLGPGEYIKLGSGEEGVITDIAWRVTTLRTSNNTLIIVPNNKFSTSIITNYDRPEKFTSLVLPFTLDLATDINQFEYVAIEVGRELTRDVPGVVNSEPQFEYVAIASTGITVNLIVQISDYLHQGRIRTEALKRIHKRLLEAGSLAAISTKKPVELPTSSNKPVGLKEEE